MASMLFITIAITITISITITITTTITITITTRKGNTYFTELAEGEEYGNYDYCYAC